MQPILAYVYPVDPGAAAAFKAMSGGGDVPPQPASHSEATSGKPLSKVQGELLAALSGKPLNYRQVAILEIYLRMFRKDLPPLSVGDVVTELAANADFELGKAADYVKGALRSFGRRLSGTLTKVPLQFGVDSMGDGVADEFPLLAMFAITKGGYGEARHKLTPDGAIAVSAALAVTKKGNAASTPFGDDDPDEMVALGMTRKSAALIMRVAFTNGKSIDEAIQIMTAQAGAG